MTILVVAVGALLLALVWAQKEVGDLDTILMGHFKGASCKSSSSIAVE